MKRLLRNPFIIAAAVSSMTADAASLTWDTSIAADGTITDGGGNWATGAGNWNNGATSVGINWTAGDIATFSGTAGGNIIVDAAGVSQGGMTFNGSNNYTVSGGAISGAGGLTKNGSSTVTLSGANTYAGNMAVNGGTLQIGGTGTLGASSSYAGAISVASGATFSYASSATQTLTGTISGLGRFEVASGQVNLGKTGNNQLELWNGSALNTVGGILIRDGGILNVSVTTANSIRSNIELRNGGVLTSSSAAPGDFGHYYVHLAGTTFTGTGANNVISNAKIGLDTTLTLATAQSSDNLLVSAQLGWAGRTGGGVTKTGAGTVTLAGVNIYTGATTINGGTLNLDFAATGAPSANIINNTANSSALSMGGATLLLTGKASTTNSQRFNGLSLTAGSSTIQLAANALANPLALSLGAITRTGGVVNFVLPAGTQDATNGITTSSPNGASGILGHWAFVGTGASARYATVSGSNVVAYTGGTAAADATGLVDTTGAVNYDLAAATGTVPATVSANTIRYTGGAGTTAPGTSFSVNGLLNVGGGLWTIGTNQLTIGAARDLVVNTASGDIAISSAIANNAGGASSLTKSGTGTLTLSGGNTFTGAVNANAGTLVIKATSNADWAMPGSGNTIASGATMQIDFSAQTSGNRQTTIRPTTVNGTLDLTNTFLALDGNYSNSATFTGAGTIKKSGTGYYGLFGGASISGFTGLVDVQQGVLGSNNNGTWATATNTMKLNVGSGAAFDVRTGSVTVGELTGSGRIGTTHTGGLLRVGGRNTDTIFTGVIENNLTYSGLTPSAAGTMSLEKVGTGSLTLTGSNSFGAGTSLYAGTLIAGHNNAFGTGAITVNGGALRTGSFTVANTVNITAAAAISGNYSGTVNSGTNASTAINTTGGVSVSTLNGQGTFSGGLVTVNTAHNPGNSPGSQTFNSGLAYGNGATVNMEIAANGLTWDSISVTNGLTIGATASLNLTLFGAADYTTAFWDSNHSFQLITADGITGDFTTISLTGLGVTTGQGAWSLDKDLVGVGGYTATWTAVPEPSAALLGGLGVLALLRRRRH